jgi:hypothetical protein
MQKGKKMKPRRVHKEYRRGRYIDPRLNLFALFSVSCGGGV